MCTFAVIVECPRESRLACKVRGYSLNVLQVGYGYLRGRADRLGVVTMKTQTRCDISIPS